MNPDLGRRIRVLRLRQRVEACSWRVHSACFGLSGQAPAHVEVRRRLRLLTAWARDDRDHERLRATAAELDRVYRQCCDVLHGRRAFTDLPESLVRGWERAVEDGERTIGTALGAATPRR